MTFNNNQCGSRQSSGAERVTSVLLSRNLKVREVRQLAPCMVFALQPLAIEGKEICADTVLAESVRYETADHMIREISTMTLKKAAFGALGPSMTHIPKYCFTDVATLTAVMVHSVHRLILDDILSAVEKEYQKQYSFDPFRFYSDWASSVAGRLERSTQPGMARILRMALKLPENILPMPPHISQLQRKTFADRILRAVEQHHSDNVYHDCISGQTIFFPTPYQPQILSNYSGVPSAILYDNIPAELMTGEAVTNYGPQYRDVYCLALVCYRIMTGCKLDGKRFTLESPRPLGTVLSDIVRRSGIMPGFRSLKEAKTSLHSLFKTVKGIVALVPRIFQSNGFTAWRKINRATGGLWRSLPVIGPLSDIITPSSAAQALRYILDKQWLLIYPFQKGLPPGGVHARGPAITLLTSAFHVRRHRAYPGFESVMNILDSEAVQKRNAFGSIMESGLSIKRAYRFFAGGKKLWIWVVASAAVLAMVVTVAFLSSDRHQTGSHLLTKPVLTAPAVVPEATKPSGPIHLPETRKTLNETAETGKQADNSEAVKTAVVRKKESASVNKKPAKNNAGLTGGPKGPALSGGKNDAAVSAGADSVRSLTAESVAVAEKIVLPPKGLYTPVAGNQDVFIVAGLPDSCNPGKLYYSRDGKEGMIMVSQLPNAPVRLYLSHRLSKGFSPIEIIRLCHTSGCDKSMYYKPVGVDGVGSPVYVTSGDILSQSRLKLWQYIQEKRASAGTGKKSGKKMQAND